MTSTPTADGRLNLWAEARSGNARIRCFELEPHLQRGGKRFEVYALDGHELLPGTRRFVTLDEARTYANDLWRTL